MIASLIGYASFFLTLALIFGVAVLGLNLQWGAAGLFNVGVAGFVLVGAYVSALLTAAPSPQHFGGFLLPIPLGWFAAMAASAFAATVVGVVTLRLRADYLAITTFGAAASLQLVALNAERLTGGPFGIALIPRPFEALADRPVVFGLADLALVATVTAICFGAMERLARSPWGRVLRAAAGGRGGGGFAGQVAGAVPAAGFRDRRRIDGSVGRDAGAVLRVHRPRELPADADFPGLGHAGHRRQRQQCWRAAGRGAGLGPVDILGDRPGARCSRPIGRRGARACGSRRSAWCWPRRCCGGRADCWASDAAGRERLYEPLRQTFFATEPPTWIRRPPAAPVRSGPHRIIVAGGGAAGLELVTKLGDMLGKRERAHVTLVERARTHLWKPLLHSVAAGSLRRSQHELNYLAQAHWHGFMYRFGEVVGLDRAARLLHLGATFDEEGRQITPPRSLPYDTLVMAIGSVTNDFGTPGAAQYAVPLETPEQASRFNRRIVNACLRANTQPGPVRPGQLHIAIIGAGATGTELAAELHRTVREVVAFGLDRIDPERDIHIVLIEAAERILPALPERISAATTDLLARAWRGGAHRRAGERGAGGLRGAVDRRDDPVGTGGVVGRGEGARGSEGSGRAGEQPHQPVGRAADIADHARRERLCDR